MPPSVCWERAPGANARAMQMHDARKKVESRTLWNICSSDRCGQTSKRECRPKVRTVIFCVLLEALPRCVTSPQRWTHGTPFFPGSEVFLIYGRYQLFLWLISTGSIGMRRMFRGLLLAAQPDTAEQR